MVRERIAVSRVACGISFRGQALLLPILIGSAAHAGQ
jgi:hypothetical protein